MTPRLSHLEDGPSGDLTWVCTRQHPHNLNPHSVQQLSCSPTFRSTAPLHARLLHLILTLDSWLAMFSGSNSYLGGANSARPGQPPYGQQQSFQQPSGFQGGLGSQPAGFGAAPMQQQFTGFPGQQQSQFTGYPGGQQNQSFQQPPLQQSFQTGIPPPQLPSVSPQIPQLTGMTSSQMADSFRGSASQQLPPPPPAKSNKIPNIRLSFITAQDQAKFEQLFKSAAGNSQALTGEQARDLLLRSKLSGDALGHIWWAGNFHRYEYC